MKSPTQQQQLLKLARRKPLITLKQIRESGITSNVASRLVAEGGLIHIGPGFYRHPDAPVSEHQDLIEISAHFPRGVVVLLSALQFHRIGTQQPHQIWFLIPYGSRMPVTETLPVRTIRSRVPDLFKEGVERHDFNGIGVWITTPARTVADCFKFRRKIGIDVCVEALKETLRKRLATYAEIDRFADRLHVRSTVQPYLESLI